MKILNTSIKFKEVRLNADIVVLTGAKEIPEWESNARKHGQDLTADQIANLITNIAEQKLNSDFGSQREIVLFEAYRWIFNNRTGKLHDEANDWLCNYLAKFGSKAVTAKQETTSTQKGKFSTVTNKIQICSLKLDTRRIEGLVSRIDNEFKVKVDEHWEFKKNFLFNELVKLGIKQEDALEALNGVERNKDKGQYIVEDDNGNMFYIVPI